MRLITAIAFLCFTLPFARAQDVKGAADVLGQIEEARQAGKPRPQATTPAARLRKEMVEFRDRVPQMPPQQAAKVWLQFVDRVADQMKVQFSGGGRQVEFAEAVAILPPPAAWPALAEAVKSRPAGKNPTLQNSLVLLTQTLLGDTAGQTAILAKMEKQIGGQSWQKSAIATQLIEISEEIAKQSGDAARIAKAVELKIALAQSGDENSRGSNASIPDLVPLVGPVEAERLLRKALLLPTLSFEDSDDNATMKLARRLAHEMIARMPAPHWELVESIEPDSVTLFEAFQKRFDKKKPASNLPAVAQAAAESQADNSNRNTARAYYLMGLVAAGRTEDALKFTSFLTGTQAEYGVRPAIDALAQSGRTRQAYEFVQAALTKNPKLPLWDALISHAPTVGKAPEMLAMVKTAASRTDLPASTRRSLRDHLYKAYLAADQIDPGIATLRALIKDGGADNEPRPDSGSYAIELARLGQLLNRKELFEEGIAAALKQREAAPNRAGLDSTDTLVDWLVYAGRAEDAEKLIVGDLVAANANGRADFSPSGSPGLKALARLYSRLGRHADVLTLFERAPGWGVRDLADFGFYASSLKSEGRGGGVPVGYIAAKALAVTGRPLDAQRVIESVLYSKPGFDPAYALLIELRGVEALPYLDHLYKLNRFEERPLIWKAALLLKENRLEEAEKTAKDAIAIDPSDGEQGPGDRMRVYAVLADIRDARGDKKQADFLRGAVRAIRRAEEADRYRTAGLLLRAIAMYRESLTYFADAYCIQSRLAVELAEAGRYQEAEEHYRRAYELMPDSFGRMESHCFGCEGVFKGKRAETIAEKVFTDLAAKNPNKPQVHYLLGYLRDSQSKPDQALPHFRRAVALDPDYVNAWSKILQVGPKVRMPRRELDSAQFQLIRLGKTSEAELRNVSDFKGLWKAIEAASEHSPPDSPTTLFPLQASAAAIANSPTRQAFEQFEDQESSILRRSRRYGYDSSRRSIELPGEAIAEHSIMAAISQIVTYSFSNE